MEEAIDNAKLEWLLDKAEQFGIYVPSNIKNDLVRLESWINHKISQKGLNLESNVLYSQWKEFSNYVKRFTGKWASSGIMTKEAIREENQRLADQLTEKLSEALKTWYPQTDFNQFMDYITGDPNFIQNNLVLDISIDTADKINILLYLMYKTDSIKAGDLEGFQLDNFNRFKADFIDNLEEFIFETQLLEDKDHSRELFGLFSRMSLLYSKVNEEFVDFDYLNNRLIKDLISKDYSILSRIRIGESLTIQEIADLRRNVLNHKFSTPALVSEINTRLSNMNLERLSDNNLEFVNLFGEEGTEVMILAGKDQSQLDTAFNEILRESSSLGMAINPNYLFGKDRQETQKIFNKFRKQNQIKKGEKPLSLIYFELQKGDTYYKGIFFVRKMDQPLSGLRRSQTGEFKLVKDDFYSRRYPGVLKGHYPGSNKFLIPSLLGLETYEKYSVKELTEQKLQAECTERIAMIDFDLLLLHNQFDGGKVVMASEWWLCDNCKYNYRLFEENCIRNNINPTLVDGTNKV